MPNIPSFQHFDLKFRVIPLGKEGKEVAENLEEKTLFSGEKVKVVGAEYEKGMPEQPHQWRGKIQSRQDMLKYLQNGERYWFSKDWYGSEKRKTPA